MALLPNKTRLQPCDSGPFGVLGFFSMPRRPERRVNDLSRTSTIVDDFRQSLTIVGDCRRSLTIWTSPNCLFFKISKSNFHFKIFLKLVSSLFGRNNLETHQDSKSKSCLEEIEITEVSHEVLIFPKSSIFLQCH